MPDLSQFDYPGPRCMYDPVRKLRVANEPGRNTNWDNVAIGIHYDPEIERGHYWMPRKFSQVERQAYEKNGWDISRPVPFRSDSSQLVVRVDCSAHDVGHAIRLKISDSDLNYFQRWDYRTRIENLNIPLVSKDLSSMYIDVFKAFPGLPILRTESFPVARFPEAQTIEMCIQTSTLIKGLRIAATDFPLVEEGWHCLASWPMLLDR